MAGTRITCITDYSAGERDFPVEIQSHKLISRVAEWHVFDKAHEIFFRIAEWHVFDKAHEKVFYASQDGMPWHIFDKALEKVFTDRRMACF